MKKMLLRLATLALLFTGVAAAQTTGSITGVVTDGATGKPVVGAVVVATSPAVPGEQTVVTDAKGAFTIANLPAGRYKLQASFEGYKPEARGDLALGENVTLRANLAIVPEAVQMEEVVVTGSRIKRKDLTTPAPVTVMNREAVVASGKVSIGDFLQSMPEQGNAINTQVNNGGDGSTRINLRSLGTARTLVLVNGRRFVAGGTGADATVDLNSIPTAAIERIEILKDGASAVYGSDAIAGVVNIITRKRFNGTEVSAFTGVSGHNDGQIYDVNFVTGTGTEKGNLLFGAGYYQQKTVWAGDRDFSRTALTLNFADGSLVSGGSSAIPMGRATVNPSNCTTATCQALVAAGITTSKNLIVDPAAPGGFRVYNAATDPYNFQPENYLVTPQQRASVFATGDSNFGNVARGYFEASYVNRKSAQKLAPEPLFTQTAGPNGVILSADSMYNPFKVNLSNVRRRLVEFGNRDFTQDLGTFRVVTGVDGSLSDWAGPLKGWTWDVSYNYGRTQGVSTTNGTLRVPKIAAALGPSRIDPGTGKATCYVDNTFTTPIDGCVPLDLLGGLGTITPDMVKGLGFFGTDRGYNQQEVVQIGTSGELFRLFADRPIGLALGFDYRHDRGASQPNPISGSGENSGNNFDATIGGYVVKEGYAELVLPLINNVDFAQDLELTAAARVFNYSTFGSDNTYKVGARWTPVRDFTLRGTYSTAFRAPNIGELYSGQADNFAQVKDPCGTGLSNGSAVQTQCIADGAIPGFNPTTNPNNGDDRAQLRSRIGGNPNLTPETAKVFTVGAVIEPRWVPNLSVTVDFYSIDLKNSISTIGEGVILQGCYSGTVDRKYCGKITRDPTTGQILNIDNLSTNVGGDKTAGLDVAARYNLPTEAVGKFAFGFDGTMLQKFDRTLADGTVIKAKGTYDLFSAPSFKANLGVNWSMSGLSAGLSGRYIGSYKECSNDAPSNGGGTSGADGLCYARFQISPGVFEAPLQRTVETYMTFDGYVGYSIASVAGKTSFTVGAQNLLDRKPAKVYDGFLASSDAATYDYMGRYIYARLTQAF